MSQNPSKKALLLVVGALVALTLTGCAAGPDAPTRHIKKVTDGAEADSGDIKIRDVVLVAQSDGSAVLVATVDNVGAADDAITAISVKGIPAVTSGLPIALTQNNPSIFSGDSANASAVIPGFGQTSGSTTSITFTFKNAAAVTFNSIVRDQTGIYANVTVPTAVPVASASPSATK
ncbi:MAG: hypothetical protein WCO08_04810 [Actinomycetes bacterium]